MTNAPALSQPNIGLDRAHAARRKIVSLALGVALAAVAVLPPIDSLAEVLFSAHMAQHLWLVAVAAPLIAVGLPVRLVPQPPFWPAWTAFVGIFLFWHWPVAFRWAAASPLTEAVELLSISLSALLFWTTTLRSSDPRTSGLRGLCVIAASVALDLPGVIMIFAPSPICTLPAENAAAFGLSTLEDQQLAGVLMWVPANIVFFSIGTLLFARWLRPDVSSNAFDT